MKNIFFDYGNTLISFEPFEIVKSFGVEDSSAKLLSDIIFDRLYFDRLDDGSISQKAFKEAVLKRVPKELSKIALHICDNWGYHLPLIDGMAEIVSDLKRNGYKLYILSNISENFADNADKIYIFKYFDGFVFSGKINKIKPDSDFFEYALEKFDVKPEDAIFIDDSEKNIMGAKNAGIAAVLFDGNAQNLRNVLKSGFGINI